MTYLLYIDKKKRVFLILLCIVIIFGSVFGSYQEAEASATVVVEGTFLYWLYITLMGGATYDSYEASKRSYESFKSDYPHAFENFKSNIGNIAEAYMSVMNTGEGLSGEQGLQTAGEEIGKALPEALSSIWQSLNTWLDSFSSSSNISSIPDEYVVVKDGFSVKYVKSSTGFSLYVNSVLLTNMFATTSNAVRVSEISDITVLYDRVYVHFFWFHEGSDSSYPNTTTMFRSKLEGTIPFPEYSPGATGGSIVDSLPATGFPEYSPGKPAVPFPFFPPGFGNPGADGSGWTYTPGANVEVPIGDITNPDGSLKHPGDWSGDWVGGVPVPGTGAGTGSVPAGWGGAIPVPGTATGNPAIPGVGDNTWAGDNVTVGDIPVNPDITVPVVPVVPGEINWNPILDAGAGLKTKFPFCLPYDLISMVESFTAEGVAPSWDINFKVPNPMNRGSTQNASIKVDFEQFASFALISRIFTTAIFIIALIMASRKLIGS